MKPWMLAFFAVLAAGVAYGLASELLSTERGRVEGTVIDHRAGGTSFKSFGVDAARYKVRLAGGREVLARPGGGAVIAPGNPIALTEWVTPWGQLWYTQRD